MFFFQYIYISLYIYLYLYIYIEKRTERSAFFYVLCVLLHSLQKNFVFFAFVYVLCKRMLHSLRSFPFFRKGRKRTKRSFGFPNKFFFVSCKEALHCSGTLLKNEKAFCHISSTIVDIIILFFYQFRVPKSFQKRLVKSKSKLLKIR